MEFFILVFICLSFNADSTSIIAAICTGLSDNDYKYALVLYIAFCMLVPCLQYRVFQDRHPLNVNVSIEWLATNIVVFLWQDISLIADLKTFGLRKGC